MHPLLDLRMTLLVAAVTVSTSTPSPSHARTIPYPGGFVSLQAAVDTAAPGDTVLVAPGRYAENVLLKQGVSLHSLAGADSTILVSPGGAAQLNLERLVQCLAGVDSTTSIQGLTLEDGGFSGMGIFCEGASPVIRGNVLRGFGWGINLRESSSLVEGNVIEACKTLPVTIFAGSPRLWKNEIRNNSAAGIDVTGRKAHPVIGGSREHANRIYGNVKSLRNSSKNDIDATWNDWGWETTEEMNQKGYPADIISIIDGNDFAKSHRGRGKVDYRNWLRAEATAAPHASSVRTSSATPAESSAAGAVVDATTPTSRRLSPILPIALAGLLVAVFVGVARRRSSPSGGAR